MRQKILNLVSLGGIMVIHKCAGCNNYRSKFIMDKNTKRKTPEERLALIQATTEGKIEAKNILEEILPLIEDYFICKAKMQNGAIKMELYNGQKFTITCAEN